MLVWLVCLTLLLWGFSCSRRHAWHSVQCCAGLFSARKLKIFSGALRVALVSLYCGRRGYQELSAPASLGTGSPWSWGIQLVATSCWEVMFVKVPFLECCFLNLIEVLLVGLGVVATQQTSKELVLNWVATRFLGTVGVSLAVRWVYSCCDKWVLRDWARMGLSATEERGGGSKGKWQASTSSHHTLTAPAGEWEKPGSAAALCEDRTAGVGAAAASLLIKLKEGVVCMILPGVRHRSMRPNGIKRTGTGAVAPEQVLPPATVLSEDSVPPRDQLRPSALRDLDLGRLPGYVLDVLNNTASVEPSSARKRVAYYKEAKCRMSYFSMKIDYEPEDFEGYAANLQRVVRPLLIQQMHGSSLRSPVVEVQTAVVRGCVHLLGLWYELAHEEPSAAPLQPAKGLEEKLHDRLAMLHGTEEVGASISVVTVSPHEPTEATTDCAVPCVFPPCLTVDEKGTLFLAVDFSCKTSSCRVVVFNSCGVHMDVVVKHQPDEPFLRLETPAISQVGVVQVALILENHHLACVTPLLVLPHAAAEELNQWWGDIVVDMLPEGLCHETDPRVTLRRAQAAANPVLIELAFAVSLDERLANELSSKQPLWEGTSSLLEQLISFLREHLPICFLVVEQLVCWKGDDLHFDGLPCRLKVLATPEHKGVGSAVRNKTISAVAAPERCCKMAALGHSEDIMLPAAPQQLWMQLSLCMVGFRDGTLESCYQKCVRHTRGRRDMDLAIYCLRSFIVASCLRPEDTCEPFKVLTILAAVCVSGGLYLAVLVQEKLQQVCAPVVAFLPIYILQEGFLWWYRAQGVSPILLVFRFFVPLMGVMGMAALQPWIVQVNLVQTLMHVLVRPPLSASVVMPGPGIPRVLLALYVLLVLGCCVIMDMRQRAAFLHVVARNTGKRAC